MNCVYLISYFDHSCDLNEKELRVSTSKGIAGEAARRILSNSKLSLPLDEQKNPNEAEINRSNTSQTNSWRLLLEQRERRDANNEI